MTKFYNIFLEEILTNIKKIKVILEEKTFEDFCSNYHLVDDVVRYLKTIGEAAKHIPEETKLEYMNVPWGKIIELRELENHDIDLEFIWNMAKSQIIDVETLLVKFLHQDC